MKKKITKAAASAVKGINNSLDVLAENLLLGPPGSPDSSSSSISISTSNSFETLANMDSSKVIDSLGGPGKGSQDDKLDFIIKLIMDLKATSEKNALLIEQHSQKINALEKENASIKRELRSCKESINRSELYTRSLTVRILGLPISAEESRALPGEANRIAVKTAYEKVLKPIFNIAKTKGTISTLPQFSTAIDDGFRLKSNFKDKKGNSYPPPILIRFNTRHLRTEVFKNKREALASISQQEGTTVFIVEDLTSPTIKKMKELRADSRIEKVWSTEGSIRFTLKDDPSKPRTYPGAYTPINEFIK
jgi:hypothetical protein